MEKKKRLQTILREPPLKDFLLSQIFKSTAYGMYVQSAEILYPACKRSLYIERDYWNLHCVSKVWIVTLHFSIILQKGSFERFILLPFKPILFLFFFFFFFFSRGLVTGCREEAIAITNSDTPSFIYLLLISLFSCNY